jgi:hypothetical protein
MQKGLNRYCGRGHLHFLTLNCEGEARLVTIDSADGQNPGDNRPKPHAQTRRVGHPNSSPHLASGPPAPTLELIIINRGSRPQTLPPILE